MATSDTLIPGADHAALVPLGSHAGAPPILIKRPLTAIGSRKDAVRVHLDSSTVSKVHCVIVLNDWGCYVHDMGSRTHTWVNGKQVEDADLADGDLLRVGRFEFKYVAPTQVVARTPKPASDHLDVSTLSDPLAMPKRVVQIGRRAGSDLQLDDVKISNIHAILFDCNGMRFIRDLASRTGTWLDGKPIHQEPLYDGASIKLGATTLTYRQTPTEAAAQDRSQGSAATAPLTLQEAAPTPNLGLDSAAELELADLDLDELELPSDDAANSDADSNDALADLRRNWQAPARHTDAQPAKAPLADTPTEEKPLESSAAAIESPVADVVSDATPAAPLPLADASYAEPVAEAPPELPAAPAEPPAAIEPEPVIPPATADALPLEPLIADSDTEPADDSAAAEALELDLEPLPTPETSVNAQPAETAEVSAPLTPAVSQPSDIDVPPPPVAAETVPSPEAALADLELDDLALDDLELDLDDVVEPLPAAHLQDAPAESSAEALAQPPASAEVEPEVESIPLADAAVAADEDNDWADLDQPASDAEAGLDLDTDLDTGIPVEDVEPEPHRPTPEVPAAKVATEVPRSETPALKAPAAELPPATLPAAPSTPAAPSAEPPRPQPKPEPAFEVDAIDLSLDLDQPFETPDDATALAVDFGLDELDHGDEDDVHVGSDTPVVEAAEPSFDYESPTGGLASAARDHTTPGANADDELEPVDLSQLNALAPDDTETDDDAPARPLIDLADTVRGEDSVLDTDEVFEAESIEVLPEDAPTAQAAADDDIPPPRGGTLDDLMPQGPPLVGGAFTGGMTGPVIGGSPSLEFRSNESPEPKRRAPLRVGFGGQNPRGGSPFASNTPSIGDVLVGRRGGPSVDVFANPSPTPEELLLSQSIPETSSLDDGVPATPADELADVKLSPEQREILQTAEAFRPRAPVAIDTPIVIPPAGEGVDVAAQRAAAHKARVGRVFGLLVLLFVLLGATFAGVYNYVPVYSTVYGLVQFPGLDTLGTDDARQFRAKQADALQSESVRQNAVGSLPAGVPYGFLSDIKQLYQGIDHDPKDLWPADQAQLMRLAYHSTDKANDLIRMRALAQAIVDANAADIARAEALRAQIASDQNKSRDLHSEIDRVNGQIQALQQAGNDRPGPERIAALTADRQQAETALREIRSSRQELEATEDRLSKQPAAGDLPAPDATALAADQSLTKLNAQLADLQKQSELRKVSADEKSNTARKQLDDSIADFQQGMQSAQKLRDNPQLTAYVDAANRIFMQTRQLTEDLIHRQENQRTRLSELKSRLSDRIAARTADLLSKDEELKKLNDRLAIGTRQYNAAVASGYTDEAKKIELENTLVKSLIAARTDLYKNDPVYSDTITQLQQIIEQTQSSIDEDRKHIDETLTKAQNDFVKTAPAVEQLPAEQKALASAIEQKLAAVNAARKAYDSASQSSEAEQAKIDADLKEKTAAVQLEIAARKHDLAQAAQQQQAREAAAARQKQLDTTRAALADARTKEDAAQKKLDDATSALELAQKQRREFSDSDADRETKLAAKVELERSLQETQAKLATRQSELARLIVPKRDIEIRSDDPGDRRLGLASIIAGGIFVLLMIPIVWNLVLLWRDAHPHTPAIYTRPPALPEESAGGFEPVLPPPGEPADDRKPTPLLASS